MSDRITPRLENQGRNGGISGAGKVIHNFIKNKDLTSLEWTLQFKEAQKEINFRNKKGLTPLMVAASQCDWDNCLLLLRYKPEFLPRKCQAAQAPWLLAREHGDHKLAAYLLSAYNDETLNGLTKNFGSQLIHERCSKKKDKFDESDMEELKWLFSQFGGALVNYTDAVMRDAPIISVLRAENDELAEYMLRECSVHLLTQDVSEFKSILHIAIQKELQVRYLITEQEPQVLLLIDQDKRSPFFLACMKGDSEYIQWVFHKFMSGDRYIYSPLSEGAVVDDIGRVATSPVLKVSTPSFVKEDDSMSNPEGEGNKGSKEKKESLLGESGEETDGSIELHHVSVEVGRDDVVDGEPMWKTMSMSSSVSSSVSRFSEVTESMSIANRDVNEDSVFHILARQGNHELMDFIFFNGRTFDRNMSPDVFLQPCGHTKGEYTPVQLAIQENHAQCLQVMLGYIMEQLVRTKDEDLIKRITDLQLLREAICNGSIGSVKVVICFGLWYEELDDASLYSLCNRQSTELLFLLVSLYAARNVIKSRINKSSDLLTGTIKWSDLYICNLHPLLLPIASNVIHQCERYLVEWTSLQTGSSQENASPQQDRAFLQQIGKMCLATVEEQFVPSPVQSSSFSRIVSVPRKWRVEEFTTLIHITHFDLANNELHQIPIEVFLLPSLEELNLSNNQLKELPSVSPPVQNVGQRPTYQSHCLKVLNLSNNHLCFLPPQLFTLGQLEELDASHNELHYLPLLLWLPSKLKTLTLHHNQLTQLHCLSHELLVNSKSFIKTAQSCWYNQVEDCTDSDDDLLLSSMYEGHFEDTWDYCGSSPVRQVSTDLKDLTDIKKEELRSLLDFIREKFRTIEEVNDLELEPQSSREPQTPQVETLQNWFRHSKIWSPRSPTGTLKRSTEESSTQDHVDSSRELSEATPQNSSEPGDPYHQPSTLDLIEEENLPLNSLSTLDLSYNHFTVFPWDLPCLAPSLVRVNLSHNKISATNLVRDFPDNVKKIVLSNCELRSVMVEKDEDQPNLCGHLITQILGSIFKENWTSDCCVHRKYPSLPHLSLLDLSNNNCDFLPLSPSDIPQAKDGVKAGKNKSDSTYFPSLSTLILNGNSPMRTISRSICKLPFLTKLDISHTSVDSFPSELGLCPKLLVLNAEGIPSVKGDLQSFLVNNDTGGLVSYLKSLHQDSRPYHAIKLMVVGDTAKGKTTLVGNLAKKCPIRRQKDLRVGLDGAPLSTEGVDILDWEYPSKSTKARPTVRFYTWDFGGQKEYYATHQVFLTKRSLYLLVFDAREGVEGIHGLQRWLENIDSKASGSPVIVVGTHIDQLQRGHATPDELKTAFYEMYHNRTDRHHRTYAGLQQTELRLLNTFETAQVQALRDYVYSFVLSYNLPTTDGQLGGPLLDFQVPAVYLKIQKFVGDWAIDCKHKKEVPIINREKFVTEVMKNCQCSEYDVHQATLFLHSTGILLHYTDIQLCDFYFIDPQWLSTVLARVVSIPDLPAFHTCGFMETSALQSIFGKDDTLTQKHFKDITGLMQKFDVALILDHQSRMMLIPSLLPDEESSAQLVRANLMIEGGSPNTEIHVPIKSSQIAPAAAWQRSMVRWFFLPYIPEGVFPRLVARIIASGLAGKASTFLPSVKSRNNSLDWSCWSKGFALVYNNSEMLRVSAMKGVVPGARRMEVVGQGYHNIDVSSECTAIEVEVAILPREDIELSEQDIMQGWCALRDVVGEAIEGVQRRYTNIQLATYLLNILTEEVRSVFEDWYPQFSCSLRPYERDKNHISMCDCCPRCLQEVKTQRIGYQMTLKEGSNLRQANTAFPLEVLYLFPLPSSTVASSSGAKLHCPVDGELPVDSVAPDVEFKDLYCKPVTDFCEIKRLNVKPLGKGAFGSVFLGEVCSKGKLTEVAIKEFVSSEQDSPNVEKQWTMYQNASIEARIMSELHHPNILSLVGMTLHPWCLLLEYAPRGDLKKQLKDYKHSGTRFGQLLTIQVMTQIAEAMKYLHESNIVYRDLKPGNVLVWKFPRPFQQWKQPLSVLVKVADYGISKRSTPWGIKADKGTEAFQPPESGVHHSTKQFATNKFDVYSYGILLYCLFTGLSPYTEYQGPLLNYVQKGGRPMLPVKSLPRLQAMFELMCLCWSQKPHHRPDFQQILDLLNSPQFRQVLTVEGLFSDQIVTCAAFWQTQPPTTHMGHRRMDSVPIRKLSSDDSDLDDLEDLPKDGWVNKSRRRHSEIPRVVQSIPLMSRRQVSDSDFNRLISTLHIPSISSSKAKNKQEEGRAELWYATTQKEIIVKDSISDSVKTIQVNCIVNTMVVIDNHLWCGLQKRGVCVYDMESSQWIAHTQSRDALTVNSILVYRQLKTVYILTECGSLIMYSNVGLQKRFLRQGSSVEYIADELVQTHVSESPLKCGCLVPVEKGCMLWIYAQEEHCIYIYREMLLHYKKLQVPENGSMLSTNLSTCHMLLMSEDTFADSTADGEWSTLTKSHNVFLVDHMFMIKYNATTFKPLFVDFSLQLRNSMDDFITSVICVNRVLYLGTHSGRILLVDPENMDLLSHTIHPFNSPITCLLGLEGILNVDQSKFQNSSSLERRERRGAASPFHNLYNDEQLLVAFGMDYNPFFNQSLNRPTQLLMPVVYEGEQPPDPRESTLQMGKHPRVNVNADCQMIVFDLSTEL